MIKDIASSKLLEIARRFESRGDLDRAARAYREAAQAQALEARLGVGLPDGVGANWFDAMGGLVMEPVPAPSTGHDDAVDVDEED